MTRPATYRLNDNSRIEFADALKGWGDAAFEELRSVASRYQSVVTYKELSELVQERSGVRTSVLMMHWIGSVLELVAKACVESGESPLTSLCVHQDGTIGDGYAKAAVLSGNDVTDDIEAHAAAHRLACYRRHATDLPEDGGQAQLTRQVAERRNRARAKRQEPPVRLCLQCWTTLPASGLCTYCV